MKKARIVIAVLILVMGAAIFTQIPAHATWGVFSTHRAVLVGGRLFALGGYSGDDGRLNFRLEDVAYILNGTTAQFNIVSPPDDRWDFWIVRGEGYTPTGHELAPIPPRHAVMGSYGFAGGEGLAADFEQLVVVGVDTVPGSNVPAFTVVLHIIEDEDGQYFSLFELGDLLGFVVESSWYEVRLALDPEHSRPIQVLPVEVVTLLSQISGHWVHDVHFYGDVIDETVIWPVEFYLCQTGFRVFSNWPTGPMRIGEYPTNYFFQVDMAYLDNGLVEITINPNVQVFPWQISFPWDMPVPENIYATHDVSHLANYRIVVDTTQPTIEVLTLYIGDTTYTMVRQDWRIRDARRHTVSATPEGYITLRYVLGNGAVGIWDLEGIHIYRSREFNQRGELIYIHRDVDPLDRILFEFTDTTAVHGHVYYYQLTRAHSTFSSTLWVAGQSQIRVDTVALLGPVPEPEEPPTTAPLTTVPVAEVVTVPVTTSFIPGGTTAPTTIPFTGVVIPPDIDFAALEPIDISATVRSPLNWIVPLAAIFVLAGAFVVFVVGKKK